MTALSSALVLIITPALKDPNLIWPFVGIGGACFVSMFCVLYVRSTSLTHPGRD